MPSKKNQHYIPQFYLRNFSIDENQKTIGVFNLNDNFFFKGASIKNQGSEKFYYGIDGKVEEGLSKMESILAPKLKEIKETQILPNKFSDEHIAILIFIILTDLRNPINIDHIKKFTSSFKKEILQFAPNTSKDDSILQEIPHEVAVEMSFGAYENSLHVCLDLDYKLFANDTETPFIIGDFPVVKYNQFLENKKIYGSNTGLGSLGLKIFLPLSPKLCIVFYDSLIYKIGNRKDKIVSITVDDADQLNLLQYINCRGSIYFNGQIEKSYLLNLNQQSKKFEKANQTVTSTHDMIEDGKIKEDSKIFHMRTTDSKIKLKLSKVKLTRKANSYNLGNSISPLRPKAKLIIDKQSS
jgi:Protein of unknown function (DUF4238)